MLVIIGSIFTDSDKISVSLGSHKRLSVMHLFIHLLTHGLVYHLFIAARRRNELIPVRNQCGMSGHLRETFRVLFCKSGHLTDGRILFQYDLSFLIRIYFQRIRFPDVQCSADFLRNHDSSQIIYSSYDSCRFHIEKPSIHNILLHIKTRF